MSQGQVGFPFSDNPNLVQESFLTVLLLLCSLWIVRWIHRNVMGGKRGEEENNSSSSVRTEHDILHPPFLLFARRLILLDISWQDMCDWGGIAAVLIFCSLAENGFILSKGRKQYDSDTFLFIVCLFLVVSAFSFRKTPRPRSGSPEGQKPEAEESVTFMSRHQTEEWKGWMQFIFIMYHYFDAKAWYNLIRCLVSGYAFLTGYGNFCYFQSTQDFSFKRWLSLMWRLNFLTVLLMMTMAKPYVLYYIVPLHTFYFLMTFATLAIGPSRWNTNRRTMSIKLMVLFGVIWFLWDCPISSINPFDWVFWPLSPILSVNGSLHEWHFRTYLDHYSTLFGMLVAMFHKDIQHFFDVMSRPAPNSWWATKRTIIAVILTIIGVGLGVWWYSQILLIESRTDYNAVHPYTVLIPIGLYVMFRNATSLFRSVHMETSRWFGTITLETYLLQYHLFLSDYAKSLLFFVKTDFQLTNLLIVSVLLVSTSYYVFQISDRLRVSCLRHASSLKDLALVWSSFLSFFVVIFLAILFIGCSTAVFFASLTLLSLAFFAFSRRFLPSSSSSVP